MTATYRVQIDWDDDGDFADTGENVTGRTLDRSSIIVEYGRDQARALSPPSPGRAAFELDNRSFDYSPENSSSPLAGLILPARPVLIDAELSSTTYALFRGSLDDFDLMPGLPERSVIVSCLDGLAKLTGSKIATSLYHGIQTGKAIGLILDAVGWPDDKRDLDEGASTIRWWWEEDADAWDALLSVIQAEGPPAFVYLGSDGEITFRDRHHRLTESESLSSQATFSASGAEPLFSAPLVYDHGWRDVINSVTFVVEDRNPSLERANVWTDDHTYSIADDETVEIAAQTNEPFTDAALPTYTLLSGTVSVDMTRLSGQSTIIRITASGGPAVITDLTFRARPVVVERRVRIHMEDVASVTKYGERTYPTNPKWLNINDALAVAQAIVAQRSERLPIISMRLLSGNDTRLTQQLSRDLSDRVTIVESDLGLNDDFFIERIRHRINEAGKLHETVFGCEKVQTQIGNVFRFDVAGHGFDDGVFAT